MILASRSPQRRAILDQLGIAYEALPVDVEEAAQGEPRTVARANALAKARAAARLRPGETVLGADTLVSAGGRIWGKPADAAAARATLRELAGRDHEVVSGLALLRDGREDVADDVTIVRFRALDDAAIDDYVATGEWRERAGGYAIQGRGAALVRSVQGDYLNVVGLPAARLLDLLEA